MGTGKSLAQAPGHCGDRAEFGPGPWTLWGLGRALCRALDTVGIRQSSVQDPGHCGDRAQLGPGPWTLWGPGRAQCRTLDTAGTGQSSWQDPGHCVDRAQLGAATAVGWRIQGDKHHVKVARDQSCFL